MPTPAPAGSGGGAGGSGGGVGGGSAPDTTASSLYVGGLAPRVCTELLHDVFSIAGKVTLCRVVADKHSGASMGFGFVDYPDHATALRAQQLLNGRVIYGHELTVDWAHANSNAAAGRGAAAGSAANGGFAGGNVHGMGANPTQGPLGAPSGSGSNGFAGADGLVNGVDISNHYCLFIGNLDASVTDADLLAAFSAFGECSSAQVSRDAAANSRRCAFVSFKDRAAAQAAIDGLNGKVISNRPMRVDWARTKTNAVTRAAAMGLPEADRGGRPSANGGPHALNQYQNSHHAHSYHHHNNPNYSTGPVTATRQVLDYNTIVGQTPYTFTTVYVSGLPPTIDEETMRAAFDGNGPITDVRIPESARGSGNDKIYAFVVYTDHESAARAIFEAQGGLIVAARNVTVQWGRETNRASAGGGPGGRRLAPGSAGQRPLHPLQHVSHQHAAHVPGVSYGVAPAPGYAAISQHPQFSNQQHQIHQTYSSAAAASAGPQTGHGNPYARSQAPATGHPVDQGYSEPAAPPRHQRPPY